MDPVVLNILVCPLCQGKLSHCSEENELICQIDKLAYPVRGGIPIMLPDEARNLEAEKSID